MLQQPPGVGGRLLGVLSPGPGSKKLEGKSFYLNAVKSRPAAILVEAISHLGGTIESFLNKDVSFVVTGSLEELRGMRSERTTGGSDGMSGECNSSPRSTKPRESIMTSSRLQRPATGTPRPTVCGSRGMALLEKAIRNNERLKGNSVLANARSWGVKIVHVDDLLAYVQLLTTESSKPRRRKAEVKHATKYPAVSRVIKTAALKSPYLKVEDSSRKYKPLLVQSMTFPSLCYSGRFSPFEPPAPPQPEGTKEPGQNKTRLVIKSLSANQDKAESSLPHTTSPCRARKKNLGYCECCHEPFKNQDEHLLSAQHRGFVQDPSHYSVVDQLVADMDPGFAPCPPPETAAALLRLDSPQPLLTHSPSEMQTHSEAELAIQALLTHGSPSTTLEQAQSPPTPDLAPLLSQPQTHSCPDNQPSSPKTPCKSPSLACQPSHTRPPSSSPDTLYQTPRQPSRPDSPRQPSRPDSPRQPSRPDSPRQPSRPDLSPVPSDSLTISSCPDALDQPPSPYAYPPVLSPQNMFLFELLSQPDSPYSQPPVLSPQVHQKDGEGMEIESASEEMEPVPLSVCSPPCLSSGTGPCGGLAESNPERFILTNNRLADSPKPRCERGGAGRSHSLPPLLSPEQNQKKRSRSASPDPKACKRKRTAPTISQKSEPTQSFSTTGWTRHERLPSGPFTYNGQEAAVRRPAQAPESTEKVGLGAGGAASIPIFALVHALCPSFKVDNITSWPPLRVFGTSRNVFDSCTRSFPQLSPQSTDAPSDYEERTICMDGGVLPKPCPVTPNLAASFTSPSDRLTPCPASNQDSKPPQSFSALGIDSVLLPDLDTLSPSDSDSDWECDLMARLGPRANASPALSLPLPGGCQPQRLDMELLQRPCSTWTLHNTSYESRLSSVLQQPPTPPPEPASAFSERGVPNLQVTPH
ncbi:cell surface glycoprotein 1 isoform X2 [Esox lucius]|uniref:DBF4-type domain-containing protein n=1 Tax=Esox lucius TaxID=8010 RepID=A0A6Q2Y3I5_ESOLU|nr:cell surface glycoprotein 1 isoform X2 [Esox lucius]